MTSSPVADQSGRFLSMEDVVGEIKLGQATINRLHRRGEFPRKRQLSDRCVGWFESEISAWKAARSEVDHH